MYYKDAALSIIQCAEAPLEKIKMVVCTLGAIHLSAQELVDSIRKFIPDAPLAFEPDMEKVEIVKNISKPVDDRCAREEFGWASGYPLEKTIEDFLKEFKEHPEKYA